MKQAIRHQAPTLRHPRKTGIALALGALALGSTFGTAAHAASTAPLLQASNMTYLGAFAMPTGTFGTSLFEYGGHGVTPYKDPATGKRTLFMQGHNQRDGQVAQIEVPATFVKSQNWSSLPVAKVLQNFADVTDGKLGTAGDTYNGMPIDGMLAYNGRLIVGVSQAYGSSQTASHGASGLDLSQGGDFKGFYSFTSSTMAPSRALGGPMTAIPPEWQSALGGSALTGNCCLSIIGATSSGPSATVFNPNDVGTTTPIPGKTVLFYPLATPVCGSQGCEATQNNVFNLTTRVQGVAFPPGGRTVLFFGTHGTGPYCYGTQDECGDPFVDGKGPHAPPYRNQVWAYDANDLEAVKNGQKQPAQLRPYAVWTFGANEMYSAPNAPYIQGAGYDAETGRVYITQDYGGQPRVDVYQIAVPGGAGVPAALNPPANLRIAP